MYDLTYELGVVEKLVTVVACDMFTSGRHLDKAAVERNPVFAVISVVRYSPVLQFAFLESLFGIAKFSLGSLRFIYLKAHFTQLIDKLFPVLGLV